MTSLLSFLFVLGVLVFVHELGHFLMARRIGVRVLTFSLGFGPKLLAFRRGDTEYCVSAIPLGGYVKMAGENPEDGPTGAADEFLSKTKWQRFQVLVMGPIMNLVLALVVLAIVLYNHAEVPAYESQPAVVGTVVEGSPAKSAGVQIDDRIVAVNGTAVATWDELVTSLAASAPRSLDLALVRNGINARVPVAAASAGSRTPRDWGLLPVERPEIASVVPGDAADRAGLKPKDVILAVGGERRPTQPRVIELIRANADKPVPFDIERNGQPQTILVTPKVVGGVARIGADINLFEVREVTLGPVAAAEMSVKKNWEWARSIVQALGGLVTGHTSVKQLMGPVAIAGMSGNAAAQGWIQLFSLMAMISLNLGLLNLMPIPVLDGGHIAILAMEGLSRRDFSMRVKEKMLLVGFALLLMLMGTVIYNDLTRVAWIERLIPWR